MNRNSPAIALFITILTTFIVVDVASALAQPKPTMAQITVTEDAVAVLVSWPQDVIAFTSARTPPFFLVSISQKMRGAGPRPIG